MTVRDEVLGWARVIEGKLAESQHGKPDWHGENIETLLLRLFEEAGELARAYRENRRSIVAEAGDVAALAMMIGARSIAEQGENGQQ